MSNDLPDLGDLRVLKYAEVTRDVMPTGQTLHVLPTGLAGAASALAIVEDEEGTGGCYLCGLDAEGLIETDTWHESLEDALNQAAAEYVGLVWSDGSG
jgi:hypothetical protein